MSVLNNLPQSFVIYLGKNFFYPEINDRYLLTIKRMGLPYRCLEDFMNAQIKDFTLPSFNLLTANQQGQQAKLTKRGGKELPEQMSKTFTISFKLTESYLTYLIMRDQMELFYRYPEFKKLYFKPITVDFLNDQGFAIFREEYTQVTPTSLSQVNLSYSSELASFKQFQLSCSYNYSNYYAINRETITQLK